MKQRYYKLIEGKKVFFNGILIVGDRQVINPTSEQLESHGWIKYVPEVYTPTPQQLLEQARVEKLMEIESYDSSSDVNECLIHYQGETIP